MGLWRRGAVRRRGGVLVRSVCPCRFMCASRVRWAAVSGRCQKPSLGTADGDKGRETRDGRCEDVYVVSQHQIAEELG